MGSLEEINDTLQLTTEQGFPADILDLQKHRQSAIAAAQLRGRVFEFHNKLGIRRYHQAPLRNFLVHNINGKWLFWGHAQIIEQTVTGNCQENYQTSGKFIVDLVYDPTYQERRTRVEAPAGRSYF